MKEHIETIANDFSWKINIKEKKEYLSSLIRNNVIISIIFNCVLFYFINWFLYIILFFVLNILLLIVMIYTSIWLISSHIIKTGIDIVDGYKEDWVNYVWRKMNEKTDSIILKKWVELITKKTVDSTINKK